MQYLDKQFHEQVLFLQFKALQVFGKAGIALARPNNLSTISTLWHKIVGKRCRTIRTAWFTLLH